MNNVNSHEGQATRVRKLIDDFVATARASRSMESPTDRSETEARAKVGEKAIALLAELFHSHVMSESSVTTDTYPDTDGLGYLTFRGNDVIGFVDHVNGPNAAACSGFVPTKHELQQLAKFWIERIFDLDFYWFQTQSTGSSEWRECQFAERRLSRIAEVLGDDLIEALEAEVSNELCDRFGHEQWHLFLQQRQAC